MDILVCQHFQWNWKSIKVYQKKEIAGESADTDSFFPPPINMLLFFFKALAYFITNSNRGYFDLKSQVFQICVN